LVEGEREEEFARKQVSEVGHGEVLRKEEGRKDGGGRMEIEIFLTQALITCSWVGKSATST
jgi:hypothetical protein